MNNEVNKISFNIDIKTLYVLLEEIVSKKAIPFQGEPLEGLQVMGILETRTLDFKNVIILNANEGYLPQLKSFNFIPEVTLAAKLKIFEGMFLNKIESNLFFFHPETKS